MRNRIAIVARYTVLEAVRTRLPVLTVATVGVLLAASFFVREIAIMESGRFQTTFYAASVRWAAVLIAALYAIGTFARESQEKVVDVALALDVPRSHYVVGKLAGFVAIVAMIAVIVSAPLWALAEPAPVASWAFSLFLELAVIVALAVFCTVTFSQLVPAFAIVLAFYVLARALNAVRLIGAHPITDAQAWSHQLMRWIVEGIAFVVPSLEDWTRTAWLVDGRAAGSSLAAIALQSAILVTLFGAAAVFDFYRREL